MEQQNLSYKDFEIIKELGSGSFGKVQLVRKRTDHQLYALKSVNMVRLNQKLKESALNQVRLLASIHIPYVIGYKGSFFDNQQHSLCIVMQYADGGDLQGKMNDRFKNNHGEGFLQNFIWKVAFELFQGLKTLHQYSIVHRDIKSANIFFVGGIAKLGDLNVSKVMDNAMCTTHAGTPYYTSPQIWKGKKYGRKCDIWSTGCLLYEMCTLHPPFQAKDFPTLYRKVIVGNYDPIPSRYSTQLCKFIRMCLTVDENQRPEASELLQTTILGGMELSLQKFRQQQRAVNLIDPIKCPRVLRFLNNKLPQAKFESQKKAVGFATKKQIQLGEKTQNQHEIPRLSKKAKSQKIIVFNSSSQDNDQHHKLPLIPYCKNKVKLIPLLAQGSQPLKFTTKKSRVFNGLQKKFSTNGKRRVKTHGKENSLNFFYPQSDIQNSL